MMKTSLAWFVVAASTLGCGSGVAGEQLRPKDGTGHQALKEEPHVQTCQPAPGEPLVIDMRSNERSDFELAMADGVAVVSYNCKELKLLKSCNVTGEYTFAGVNRKEDVVQMQSKDEVEANIPISGAKLSAALKSGSTLDLALITVGKRRAATKGVYLEDLQGDCDGATHVIRGAYVGAFALGTGTLGHASGVVDMFGAGGGAGSTADRKSTARDGDLASCRKSETSADSPPPDCGAITRLDLVPLKKRPPGAPPHMKPRPALAEEPSSASDSAAPPPPSSASAGKRPRLKGGQESASAGPARPSTASQSGAAAPPPPAPAKHAKPVIDDEPETAPTCPPGLAWNGVICKKK